MGIQDKIIKWWVQNFYATKMTKYSPGFIVGDFNHEFGHSFQRIVMLPEQCLIELEKKVLEKYDNGEEILAQIGRLNGYSFAYHSSAPQISQAKNEKIQKFMKNVFNYGYVGLAKEAEVENFDYDNLNLRFSIKFDNHVICRKDGIGFISKVYSTLGVHEYIFNESLKITNTNCQGRGDEYCRIKAESTKTPLNINFDNYQKSKYEYLNKMKEPQFSKTSFSDYFNSKIIQFQNGLIHMQGEVFVPAISSLIYILEESLGNLNGGKELLYDIFYQWGLQFVTENNVSFLTSFLSVLGFGDIKVTKNKDNYNIVLMHFPWDFRETKDMSIMRGICSGLLGGTNLHNGVCRKITTNKQALGKQ